MTPIDRAAGALLGRYWVGTPASRRSEYLEQAGKGKLTSVSREWETGGHRHRQSYRDGCRYADTAQPMTRPAHDHSPFVFSLPRRSGFSVDSQTLARPIK